MAFAQKTWFDAPNPLTPLSAAGMNDLETRIAAAVGGVSTMDTAPAVRASNSASISIPNNTATALTFDTNRFDVDSQHFTSAAALTGTVAKTAASNALVGTGTLFTTQLSIGQLIDVPGTATERRVVTSITDDTHLTVNGNFANTAAGQTATRVNTGIVARTAGVYSMMCNVEFAANATGRRLLNINAVSGAGAAVDIMFSECFTNSGTVPTKLDVETVWKLSQWDYLEVIAFQNSGGALNITAATAYSPEFMAHRVSAG